MSKTILAVLVALMLSSGIAHADTDDDDFLRALHQQGIKDTGGDQAMVKLGRMICDLRADGYSENALMGMGKLHGNSMSDDDVKVIVSSAEAAYCPEDIP
jgi:hypothetical protein